MNEKLKKLVADTLGLDPASVTEKLGRDSEEAWDSLNHLRLITAVEEAFEVKFSMAEIQEISTVGDLERCLAEPAMA